MCDTHKLTCTLGLVRVYGPTGLTRLTDVSGMRRALRAGFGVAIRALTHIRCTRNTNHKLT